MHFFAHLLAAQFFRQYHRAVITNVVLAGHALAMTSIASPMAPTTKAMLRACKAMWPSWMSSVASARRDRCSVRDPPPRAFSHS